MKTLIILHGWQSSQERWEKVKKEIKKEGIDVIVPDLPGFKTETELDNPWNLNDYVGWFKEFSQHKRNFFLLGHSFGGRIAIKFSTKYPNKIKGLILVSSAGIKPKKSFLVSIFLPILKKLSFLPGYQFFREFFYKYILRKTDYLKVKGVMKETFKKIIEQDLSPELSKIKVPTLIIWGRNDKSTPLSDAYLIKEKIKNSKLEILENVSHAPHLEIPEKLSQTIIEFLKS
jgi:pimeloyl-ACP methyl ester carboxylesterase